ncbi:MAG TPA: hypothetical protein VMZ53_10325 [Kofleriaceae bacterium]|nr:hypothetical protein [Kofleriaceae bacterium]
MRVVVSALLLAGCYQQSAVTPCTLTCSDSPCPSGLVCGSDFVCQAPGMPLCSTTIMGDANDAGDAGAPPGLYIKAPNPDRDDLFGTSIALSSDGSWLAVGAPGEASNAMLIDGSQTDNSLADAGAVFIYKWDGSSYVFATYVKSPSPDIGDHFGASISLSANGNVLAVGVPDEDGGGVDLTGNPTDDSVTNVGAVFIYARTSIAAAWAQTRYIKPPAAVAQGHFGQSVSLSADGAVVAIGYPGNESAFRIKFTPSYIGYGGIPNGASAGDGVGTAVAVAGNGDTLFGGAPFEDGPDTGFAGNPATNGATDAGAVYIETLNGAQNRYCKASNTGANDHFGAAITSDETAAVFAVGAPGEDSNATVTDGDQTNNASIDAGAVYVFGRTGAASWVQTEYVKAPNAGGENFGSSVALTSVGTFLVVGAVGEGGRSGAAFTFEKTTSWQLRSTLKAPNHDPGDELGASVDVSDDRLVVAAGAPHEASTSSEPSDNSSPNAGAVYVFR